MAPILPASIILATKIIKRAIPIIQRMTPIIAQVLFVPFFESASMPKKRPTNADMAGGIIVQQHIIENMPSISDKIADKGVSPVDDIEVYV